MLIAAGLLTALPCHAQRVTGTFFPSAVGDIPESALPFDYRADSDSPYLLNRVEALSKEMQFARRPYLRSISAYANQSLLSPNGQLDTFTNGAELGFYPTTQTKVQLYYLPTIFGRAGLKRPDFFGQEFRGTFTHQPTDRFRYQAQLGLFNYAGTDRTKDGLLVVGGALGSYRVHDRLNLQFGYRREILGNTILSAVGLKLPQSGLLVGRDVQNTFSVTANVRPTRKIGTAFTYAGGWVDGQRVQANPFQQVGMSVYRGLIGREQAAHISYLGPSYTFLALGYQRDMSSNGNLSFIPPKSTDEYIRQQVSAAAGLNQRPPFKNERRPDVGGYFSPQLFYINSFRLDAAGRLVGKIYYTAGVGLGVNNVKDIGAHLNQSQFVPTANAAVSYRLNQRMKQEHGFYFLQSNEVYRRIVMYSQTTLYF